ncbi:MAG: phage integrase SAM-like domain-containing protein [Bacteroidota bacterium]
MATLKFLYRSKKQFGPLTARLRYANHGNLTTLEAKTKVTTTKKEFDQLGNKNTKDLQIRQRQKELSDKLTPLQHHILEQFAIAKKAHINREWLVDVIYKYHHPITVDEQITYWIQKIIDEASTRDNRKGGIGLGSGRIKQWENTLKLFKEFSGPRIYKVADMNQNLFKEFLNHLVNKKKFNKNYATKKTSDLKTALNEAKNNGVPVAMDFNKLTLTRIATYDDDMDVIYLNEKEIHAIQELELESEALINSRKWLILLCYTGQRGDALTNRLTYDSFTTRGNTLVIEMKQKKGNKSVVIPVLPPVREIYDTGLPYKISTQKLNKNLKKLGQLAKINTLTMGKLLEKNSDDEYRKVKKERPKWEYLSTHIGRRSFATNHYGKIPTPIIMNVTGHTKEETFLKYINKSSDTHVDLFLDYYARMAEKKKDEPKLTLLKSAK